MTSHQLRYPKLLSVLALSLALVATTYAAQTMTSTQFQGPKANKGTVSFSKQAGKMVLTLSEDFVVPDTPDPHWQLVDSKGNVYLLDRLKVKGEGGDRVIKQITVPRHVKDVAKVVIWCAWAEANLGEASFKNPIS